MQPRFAGGRYLFSAAALRQPLMARSGRRKPPPLLAAASSHAGPSWLPAAVAPPRRQSWCWMGGWGDRGQQNFLKTVPLLGETLDALRTLRTAFQPLRFLGLQVALALIVLPGRVCVYCRERLKHSVNTYGFESFNHNIAVFTVTALSMLADRTSLFYPREWDRFWANHRPPPLCCINYAQGW